MEKEKPPEQTDISGPIIVARYEELRGQALGKSASVGAGLGWALFRRRGMAEWLKAWSKTAVPAEMADSASPFPERDSTGQARGGLERPNQLPRMLPVRSLRLNPEITMVLASMAASHLQKAEGASPAEPCASAAGGAS